MLYCPENGFAISTIICPDNYRDEKFTFRSKIRPTERERTKEKP